LEMYHVCYGALPVDPHTGDSCQGWTSLFATTLGSIWLCLLYTCFVFFFLVDQLSAWKPNC
jgi:hypothetical protein